MADKSLSTFRLCSKCGVSKPATTDYFRPTHNSDHLRTSCRLCEGYAQEGPSRSRFRPRVLSDAERLERARIGNAENYRKNRDVRIQAMRDDRAANPEKHKEFDRQNWLKHRGPGSDYEKRRYAKRDKLAAKVAHREWRRANPEKAKALDKRNREKNRATHKARMDRWRLANPEAVAASRDRRRAREVGAVGTYTKDDVRDLLRTYGRVCFYCNGLLTKFHVDHFIPLSRGGSNEPKNLRLSCPPCNYSKGGKMPWEWRPERFPEP